MQQSRGDAVERNPILNLLLMLHIINLQYSVHFWCFIFMAVPVLSGFHAGSGIWNNYRDKKKRKEKEEMPFEMYLSL